MGYRIGHDAVAGKNTRITFSTTGWLLQWLVHATAADAEAAAASSAAAAGTSEGGLGDVTHLVLDEVHEASRVKGGNEEGEDEGS